MSETNQRRLLEHFVSLNNQYGRDRIAECLASSSYVSRYRHVLEELDLLPKPKPAPRAKPKPASKPVEEEGGK